MATATKTVPQAKSAPRATTGVLGWIRKNLFNNWYNSILTVIGLYIIVVAVRGIYEYVFTIADWTPVTANTVLYLTGQYPTDQLWRIGVVALTVSLLLGLSWSRWGSLIRGFAITWGVGLAILAILPVPSEVAVERTAGLTGIELDEYTTRIALQRIWLIANVVFVGIGYGLGRIANARTGPASSTSMDVKRTGSRGIVTSIIDRLRRIASSIRSNWLVILWLLSFVSTGVLLRGIEGSEQLPIVETTRWGGLTLNLLLAFSGIIASFPVGVLLALGRRSSLPVVKVFSTAYIELVRGVPLVSILFMFTIILALFLPQDVRFDRVLRVWLGITLFSAAYMAENVRGGLQSVPSGQTEAAQALGMSGFQTTFLIVLPQALRNVIPVIVGQFIALFKDTTLVVIVALNDILGIGKAIVLGNVEWVRLQSEVYIFIAVVFWVFTYSMSSASHIVEKSLGVGKR